MEPTLKERSKYLSKVLRHQPALLKLSPNDQGWVKVEDLLQQLRALAPQYVLPFDYEILKTVVAQNDKQRFAFSEDSQWIRANQGHSIAVDLGYAPQEPPEILFHGTATKNLSAIFDNGLLKGKRHHVHLSHEIETAEKVGGRHGKSVILSVQAGSMHQEGFQFYRSDNGVWLTDEVPPKFLALWAS